MDSVEEDYKLNCWTSLRLSSIHPLCMLNESNVFLFRHFRHSYMSFFSRWGERERDRQTDRQTDRDRETETERERQKDRQTGRQAGRQTERRRQRDRDRQRKRGGWGWGWWGKANNRTMLDQTKNIHNNKIKQKKTMAETQWITRLPTRRQDRLCLCVCIDLDK